MVDTIFADVAQPDQARIVAINAHNFLKTGGHVVISIKVSLVAVRVIEVIGLYSVDVVCLCGRVLGMYIMYIYICIYIYASINYVRVKMYNKKKLVFHPQ